MTDQGCQGMITTVSSRVVYQNPWMTVREDQIVRADGSAGVYGVIDKPAFAVIAAYENDGFHLVEQYRYTVRARYWEFPQGAYPDRQDGQPEDVAQRELAEETGLVATTLFPLGRLYNAYGMSSQPCHAFLATGLTHGQPAREVEEQDMIQRWVSVSDFEAMIRDGAIVDTPTIATYTLARIRGQL